MSDTPNVSKNSSSHGISEDLNKPTFSKHQVETKTGSSHLRTTTEEIVSSVKKRSIASVENIEDVSSDSIDTLCFKIATKGKTIRENAQERLLEIAKNPNADWAEIFKSSKKWLNPQDLSQDANRLVDFWMGMLELQNFPKDLLEHTIKDQLAHVQSNRGARMLLRRIAAMPKLSDASLGKIVNAIYRQYESTSDKKLAKLLLEIVKSKTQSAEWIFSNAFDVIQNTGFTQPAKIAAVKLLVKIAPVLPQARLEKILDVFIARHKNAQSLEEKKALALFLKEANRFKNLPAGYKEKIAF